MRVCIGLYLYVYTEIVRRLLEKGADVQRVTNTLDTPLHGSVAGNKPDIADMLIKAGILPVGLLL